MKIPTFKKKMKSNYRKSKAVSVYSDEEKELQKQKKKEKARKKKENKLFEIDLKRERKEQRRTESIAKNRPKTTEEKRNQKIQKKLNKNKEKIKNFSDKLSFWISEEIIMKMAISTGFLKRSSKILPFQFCIVIAFGMFGHITTQNALAATMGTWFRIFITPQAICARISKKETAKFLKKVLIKAMEKHYAAGFNNIYAQLFKSFSSIELEDSTQFTLHEHAADKFKGSGGSASKSAIKLNFVYSISQNVISALDIVSGATNDQGLAKRVTKRIKKNALLIRDLGYFSIDCMGKIIDTSAFFLSRLKKGTILYLDNTTSKPIDILTFLKENTKQNASIDREVYIGSQKLKVRLLAEAVPDKVKHQRIESYKKNKIKRDKKKMMNASYVEWFGYSIFVTNVSREMLVSFKVVAAIYKIRWQIELFFKRIKSLLNMHIIKVESSVSVECMIYAKLISLLLAQSIISYTASMIDEEEELSEDKIMAWLKNNGRLEKFAAEYWRLEDLIDTLFRSTYLLCKNKRKRKSSLKSIKEAVEEDLKEWIPLESAG